jgi:deoxycytidylate deaminase
MKKQPYLPEGREIKYVDPDNGFMLQAKEAARTQSTDMLQPTGVVVVKDDEVLGSGANHSWAGKFKFFNKAHKNGLCVRKFFKIPSGKGYWTCPGCVTNKNHAEGSACRNAIKKHGKERVAGADLYLWGHWWCCQTCWNAMIDAGIRDVYLQSDAEVLFDRDSPENIIGKQFS